MPNTPTSDHTNHLLKQTLNAAYHLDEASAVTEQLASISLDAEQKRTVQQTAQQYIQTVRDRRRQFGGIDRFLTEFGLSTREGIALMCLAEALLRIPDKATADSMIRDKITGVDWSQHLNKSGDLFINGSVWGLMLTGRLLADENSRYAPQEDALTGTAFLKHLVHRLGEIVVRQAILHAMKILGQQFVMGKTITEGLQNAVKDEKLGYRHSYDMLGEGARSAEDATRYFNTYKAAIGAIGQAAGGRNIDSAPSISIKLSALHPRYEYTQRHICVPALTDRLLQLAKMCSLYNIGLTVDAEEAHRLEISLEIIANVFRNPALQDYPGFGLAIQAYQKRCSRVIDFLTALGEEVGQRISVRLVKGAYWDTEIKYAQVNGLPGYPVYTRKAATDVSYLANAAKLLARRDIFYPMFASHNAYTVAAVLELAGEHKTGFEFQRLHGMGEALFHQITGNYDGAYPCRIYAPVGNHHDLLPYLVRRLLENGANTNFVNRLQDDSVPIESLLQDPIDYIAKLHRKAHPKIPLPVDIYGPSRQNAKGIEFANSAISQHFLEEVEQYAANTWTAAPFINGATTPVKQTAMFDPSDHRREIGKLSAATADDIELALSTTAQAVPEWRQTPAPTRAAALREMANLIELHCAELVALCVREAGKTLADAMAEIREAVDFCRYYANEGERIFGAPTSMPGPTGETNSLRLQGRGVFLCISPWNFPLAIFMGQLSAALMAGNCVVAKPAQQTSLIASKAIELLLTAGIPKNVIALLPTSGDLTERYLVGDPRISGVCFTGSTDVAQRINRKLAARDGPIVPLIAETGGLNAMIADSTALPEQLVDDVITSAFRSAGQRCSALRVLFIQDSIADKVIAMLRGACAELTLGDPLKLSTDIGPVIDKAALNRLLTHTLRMSHTGKLVAEGMLGCATSEGSFFAPRAFEISALSQLKREVFGPILHIIRFKDDELDSIVSQINQSGYALTFGVHSRIDERVQKVCNDISAGNCYVNRSMTGAVVGVQPFGGHGLSGTGPKTGGPHYLPRFANEHTLSVNTTASGGNTSLVSLTED
ncbi:bifunctional proline dehydrogenase/L-glutamate gamma-semialdehyde dehydrogenase PutA [Zhongshania sp.]|uniref:bifunctional proline dehydrogenase/L-glutamate gamma-semialdehyde dehydrogenase PutA n=1 Tax=Zhongshania sp. TaxID=1971902 RepID=UPI0035640FF0